VFILNNKLILTVLALCFFANDGQAAKRPPLLKDSAAESIKYVGEEQLRFFAERLWLDRGRTERNPVPISTGKWLDIRLRPDRAAHSYDLAVNGKRVKHDIDFLEKQKVESFECLVFRTGLWRGYVPLLIVDREPAWGMNHEDLAGANHKAPLSIYLVDDIRTR